MLNRRLFNDGDVVTLKLGLGEFRGTLTLGGRVVGVREFTNAEIAGLRALLIQFLWALASFDGVVLAWCSGASCQGFLTGRRLFNS